MQSRGGMMEKDEHDYVLRIWWRASNRYKDTCIKQAHGEKKRSRASVCAYLTSVRLVGHCLLDDGCAIRVLTFCTESAVCARAIVTWAATSCALRSHSMSLIRRAGEA